MIRYRVIVPPGLKDRAGHLPPTVKQKVRASLRLLEIEPMVGKLLERELAGYWSYPIHPYRVIYQIETSERRVHLVMVELRREVYDLLVQQIPVVRDRIRRRGSHRRVAETASLLR